MRGPQTVPAADDPFQSIYKPIRAFQDAGHPLISVDAKKKTGELLAKCGSGMTSP